MVAKQNKTWTEEEEKRLMELRSEGRSVASIAAALKRSSGAVVGRLGRIRARARRGSPNREVAGRGDQA
jgi:hypothetical protein